MENVSEVLSELEKKGSEQTRKIYTRHGAPESMFGVKVADMKVIAKKIKGNQELALELYDSGNSDAMYLAGMVADGSQMSKKQLDQWAKDANWYMISEYTVPGVVCENDSARDIAMKWIKSKTEAVAAAGWCTYSGILATRNDDDIDFAEVEALLEKIESEIAKAKNRVRYTMNGFVISVGGYVKALNKRAKLTAKKIGVVNCDVGETSCKVPLASEYILKIEKSGKLGKKRKTIKC